MNRSNIKHKSLIFAFLMIVIATTTQCSEDKKVKSLKNLTKEQFAVTQQCATENPFKNAYWNNKEPGIYVDIVNGKPLFSSLDKFESGTGWPSFTKPIDEKVLALKEDKTLGMKRVEVTSKESAAHLGHVFDDGPKPGGKRFCINSASLRFIHVLNLEKEGYGKYLSLFSKDVIDVETKKRKLAMEKKEFKTAILAGGCFWGVQDLIRKLPGVVETQVGYTGGLTDHQKYEEVKKGKTGHAEAIKVIFNPSLITYEKLLDIFFTLHDPTTKNQQGNDVGSQYRSAVFYQDDSQKEAALKKIKEWDESKKWKKPIVTEVGKAGTFYPAEDYHQDYLVKHTDGYTCHYFREF